MGLLEQVRHECTAHTSPTMRGMDYEFTTRSLDFVGRVQVAVADENVVTGSSQDVLGSLVAPVGHVQPDVFAQGPNAIDFGSGLQESANFGDLGIVKVVEFAERDTARWH